MKPVAVLQHNAEVPPGYLADAAAAAGVPIKVVRLDLDNPLPDLENISGIVSLGGIMGAYEEDEHSFLAPEKEYLRRAVDQNVPVLGICLGSQLLADALGGRAYRGSYHEVEFGALQIAEEAKEDPVVGTLAEPVLSFHSDTFDPPPGVEILATSSRYPHAFRCGSAVAIQSHPEADAEIAREWVERYGREKLSEEGVDAAELIASVEAAADGTARRAAQLFGAWLGEVTAAR
jgi:GMP synthase (glutamine-hydrolysing)